MKIVDIEKEFKNIYQTTYSKVLKYIIIKCHNLDDANDIVQDTYLELLKKLKRNKIDSNINLEIYIYGIANNVLKRYYFKLKNINKFELNKNINRNCEQLDEIQELKSEINLEEEFITKDNVIKIWKHVNKKDIVTAKIFYLHFVLGITIFEISNLLNITESTVKNKLYRTIREIKKIK